MVWHFRPDVKHTLAAVLLSVSLGLILNIEPIETPPAADRASPSAQKRADLVFVRSDTLVGARVLNSDGQDLGVVHDLVLDRGSGAVLAVILRDTGALGSSGDLLAVPYAAFGYDRDKQRLLLDISRKTLRRAQEMSTEWWQQMESEGWQDNLLQSYLRSRDTLSEQDRDPFAGRLSGSVSELTGMVVRLERRETHGDQQFLTAHVRTHEGDTVPVVLGPTWFVTSQAACPRRGDTMHATVLSCTEAEDTTVHVARDATVEGRALRLRSDDGSALWIDRTSAPTDASRDSSTESHKDTDPATNDAHSAEAPAKARLAPLVLLEQAIGLPVHVRGSDGDVASGRIRGAVAELNSGRIALLLLDPDENILGLGDQLRAIPWEAAAIAAAAVSLDADRDMLLAAEPLPADLTDATAAAALKPLYEAFDLPLPEFRPREPIDWLGQSNGADIAHAVRTGRDVQLLGALTKTGTVRLDSGIDPAFTITITTEEGERTIVLGPERYFDELDLVFEKGDNISIIGKLARIDGEDVILATVINMVGGARITLWEEGAPAWNED